MVQHRFAYIRGKFKNSGGYNGSYYVYKTGVPVSEFEEFSRLLRKYGKNMVITFETPISKRSDFSRLEIAARPSFNTKEISYSLFDGLFKKEQALKNKEKKEEEKSIMNRPTILFDDYANTVFNLKGSHVQLREGVLTEVEKETKVHSLPASLVPLRYESPEDVETGTVFEFKQRTYIVTGTLPLLESFDEAGNRLVLPYPVKNIFSKVSAIDINAVLKENVTFPSMKAVDSEMVKFVNDNFGAILEKEKAQKEASLSAKLGSFLGFDIKK